MESIFFPLFRIKCSEVNLSTGTIRVFFIQNKSILRYGFSIHRINRIHWITDLILQEVYVEHFHFWILYSDGWYWKKGESRKKREEIYFHVCYVVVQFHLVWIRIKTMYTCNNLFSISTKKNFETFLYIFTIHSKCRFKNSVWKKNIAFFLFYYNVVIVRMKFIVLFSRLPFTA